MTLIIDQGLMMSVRVSRPPHDRNYYVGTGRLCIFVQVQVLVPRTFELGVLLAGTLKI